MSKETGKIVTGQLSDALVPIMDGVANVAHNYAYWLNKKYGDGYCIGPRVPDYTVEDPMDIRYLSIPIPKAAPYRYGLPRFDAKYKKTLQEIPFDIVHSHAPFVSGKEALSIARQRQIPLVTTFHSKYREDFLRYVHSHTIVDAALKHIMKYYEKADMVWVPNDSTGDTLREYGYTGYYEVALNGTEFNYPDQKELYELRREGRALTNLYDDEYILLFVGQHSWKKNIRFIIQGLKELHNKRNDFRAVFVGTGPDEQAIKDLVASYNLTSKITFTGVITDRREMQSIYAIADLFIFPSLYDTAGIVVREAAAFKIPSILIRDSNASQGIIDRKNGFLIGQDTSELADTISDLIDDNEAVAIAGNGAHQTIYLPWEKIVDQVYERYIDIIRVYKKTRQR